jgi:hypothetical protein
MQNSTYTCNAAEYGEELHRIKRLHGRLVMRPSTDRSLLHGWRVHIWTLHVPGRDNEIVGTVGLLVRPMNTSEVYDGSQT